VVVVSRPDGILHASSRSSQLRQAGKVPSVRPSGLTGSGSASRNVPPVSPFDHGLLVNVNDIRLSVADQPVLSFYPFLSV
jgi:hypothetical protein